jgi:uncharacterized OB-fold protein
MHLVSCDACGRLKEARREYCPQCADNAKLVRELEQLPLELRTTLNNALTLQQVERAKANKKR